METKNELIQGYEHAIDVILKLKEDNCALRESIIGLIEYAKFDRKFFERCENEDQYWVNLLYDTIKKIKEGKNNG